MTNRTSFGGKLNIWWRITEHMVETWRAASLYELTLLFSLYYL